MAKGDNNQQQNNQKQKGNQMPEGLSMNVMGMSADQSGASKAAGAGVLLLGVAAAATVVTKAAPYVKKFFFGGSDTTGKKNIKGGGDRDVRFDKAKQVNPAQQQPQQERKVFNPVPSKSTGKTVAKVDYTGTVDTERVVNNALSKISAAERAATERKSVEKEHHDGDVPTRTESK